MMTHTWKESRARDHIENKLKDVKSVTVADYKRDVSLENIPTNKAYKVDGVHVYADILNLDDMLAVTQIEGETCHKRTLRFLNQHFRAVDRAIRRSDAKRVDFHNQRLHALIAKPYGADNESERVHRGIALGQLMIDVLKQTGCDDEQIPNAKLRVGIDTGVALAVNNGRNGGREPLFLGDPANHAAKLSAAGTAEGVYLTNAARKAIDLKEVDAPGKTALTTDEIKKSQEKAKLDVTVDEIVKEWREDQKKNPIGSFEFFRPTPPLKNLDLSVLTPSNSRRFEGVSLYADLDNFTQYVSDHIDGDPEEVVKVLHVLRAELDRVFSGDFEGRRIRFIGDCLHGIMFEGTSKTTDVEESISDATLCAGALRSSFNLALDVLYENGIDAKDLGLQIGYEYGPMTITRLGLHGGRVRCAVSRGVLQSEREQGRCSERETSIGQTAHTQGTQAVRDLFGSNRKAKDLDYNEAVEGLADGGDKIAKAARAEAFRLASPAVKRASEIEVKPYACHTK